MQAVIDKARSYLAENNYYGALYLAFTLPEACMLFEGEQNPATRLARFYDRYFVDQDFAQNSTSISKSEFCDVGSSILRGGSAAVSISERGYTLCSNIFLSKRQDEAASTSHFDGREIAIGPLCNKLLAGAEQWLGTAEPSDMLKYGAVNIG